MNDKKSVIWFRCDAVVEEGERRDALEDEKGQGSQCGWGFIKVIEILRAKKLPVARIIFQCLPVPVYYYLSL